MTAILLVVHRSQAGNQLLLGNQHSAFALEFLLEIACLVVLGSQAGNQLLLIDHSVFALEFQRLKKALKTERKAEI